MNDTLLKRIETQLYFFQFNGFCVLFMNDTLLKRIETNFSIPITELRTLFMNDTLLKRIETHLDLREYWEYWQF